MDDSTLAGIRDSLVADLSALLQELVAAADGDLATAERQVRDGMFAIGARLLTGGLALRGTAKGGPRLLWACGAAATFEGYRAKQVQTLVGWISVRRAYYWCPACGTSQVPLDGRLGLARDSHSAGVRRLLSQFGALLPFAQAAGALADAARVQTAASTVRVVTEAVGGQREADLVAEVAAAWAAGLAPSPTPAPARLYVAMDGVRILDTGGGGKEAKVGVVAAEDYGADGALQRDAARYVASFAPAAAFGQRLALTTHAAGITNASEVVVLGDGAEWIWQLAAEHCPGACCIVDWYHASERIWELGRAFYGEGTAQTRRWVDRQLARLAAGNVSALVAAWQRRHCPGVAATVRDEQVISFTNQASRMAYAQYRARGLDIGSGMVESACKHLIGAREKGPGMRWSTPGAQAVANVRVLLFNAEWATYELAA